MATIAPRPRPSVTAPGKPPLSSQRLQRGELLADGVATSVNGIASHRCCFQPPPRRAGHDQRGSLAVCAAGFFPDVRLLARLQHDPPRNQSGLLRRFRSLVSPI